MLFSLLLIYLKGAGDCFLSAFSVRLFELAFNNNQEKNNDSTDDLLSNKFLQIYKKCLMFANASAFLSTTVYGAMASMPLRKDVDAFMEKYQLNNVINL
jgi:sugar/nucleoside kinase (ribokinase family)